MSYGKGLNRCAPEKVAHRFHVSRLLAAPGAASPKGSAMLAAPTVLDQGQSGTCHAHSLVVAVWIAIANAGVTPPFIGSPRQLAACTYSDVRAEETQPGAVLPVLQDTGADLQDDATALAAWGISPMQGPTADGRNSDVENDPADNSFPEPDLTQLEKAVAVTGEYSIPVNSDAPRLVALCLDEGVPVQIGVFVDTAFERLTASDVAQPANQNDPQGGGHALCIRGYRTNAAGQLEFRVRNSWGDWCDGGDCWVSTAWLLSAWELFPCAVKLSASASEAA